ncbi:MAG: hypothetical protein WD096_01940 [Actinomycetota bacterium]
MRVVTYDYEPTATPADLAKASDLVIVGEIVGVEKGQSYVPLPGAEVDGDVSSVIQVKVDETLFGDAALAADGIVHLQVTHPAYVGDGPGGEGLVPFDHAAFEATVPIGTSGVFFLEDITDRPVYEFVIDEGAGRPAGAALCATPVQGFLLESRDGSLVSVYEGLDSMASAWRQLESMDDLRLAIVEASTS